MHGRLLLTGISGFLGAHCGWALRGDWDIVGTTHTASVAVPGVRLAPLDLADPAAVQALVRRVRPQAILHTAAMTKPEECERRANLATQINAVGTQILADAARAGGARLFYVSTDLVFDGRHPPYRESARPSPLSHYGRTKVAGERAALRSGANVTVLRTSILYGWPRGPHACFLNWLLDGLRTGEPVQLFHDQRRAFLFIDDAVEMIRRVLARPTGPRVVHLAGGESASRVRFGEEFCEVFGYPAAQIASVSMRDLPNYALRPVDCSLSGETFASGYGFRARDLWSGLRALAATSPPNVFGPRPLGRSERP